MSQNQHIVESFCPNHKQFIKLCCEDLNMGEIAVRMNKAFKTVAGYREYIYEALQISSRTALILIAVESGLVSIYDLVENARLIQYGR